MFNLISLFLVCSQFLAVLARTEDVFVPNAYIVQLDEMPEHTAGQPIHRALHKRRTSFYDELDALNIAHQVRHEFKHMNAVSVSFASDQDSQNFLANVNSYKRVWPVRSVARPKVTVNEATPNEVVPSLFNYYDKIGVNRARQELNLTGANIKVGIIDTGVDYTHPALGGCFGPDCRVAFGYDFVGDNYSGENAPTGDNDPRDTCNGHGTHVAGIVGANDVEKNFTGVAPEAILGAYRIFGCNGSSADDVIMKAMEQAFEDGMDIINLSLGDVGWPESPASRLADELALRGMSVVAAAGNEGEKGIYEVGAPSLGKHALSIASVDNSNVLAHTIRLGSDDTPIGYATSSGKPFQINDTPIVPMSTEFLSPADGCKPSTTPAKLQGMVALVARGGCVFADKIKNAQAAGAIGVLVYNNNPGFFTPSASDPAITIPFGGITDKDGSRLFELAQKKLVPATFDQGDTSFETPTSGKISSFSSWGLGPDLSMKPDVSAPGGLIYSTYPVPMGSYATLSGTSMASPMVAGMVALIHQSRGGGRSISTEELRTRLINNARLVTQLDDTAAFESVARQGAGMVDVYQAITSTTSIHPEKLELRDIAHAAQDYVYTFEVINKDRTDAEYSFAHTPATTVQGYADITPFAPLTKPIRLAQAKGLATVQLPETTLKLRAGESANVSVVIQPPATADLVAPSIYSGFIQLTKDTRGEQILVPYAGLTADLSALPVLLINDTMPAVLKPVVGVHDPTHMRLQMIQASPVVEVTVVDAEDNDHTLGWVPGGYTRYVGRNDLADPSDMFVLTWFGNVVDTKQQALSTSTGSSSHFHPYSLIKSHSKQSAANPMPDQGGDGRDEAEAEPDKVEWTASGGVSPESIGKRLPAGTYRLKIAALRVFGDENDPSNYDTWISPGINVL
ncbi:peptidase S8/S53 domain-containing protein [Gongronella butleri]|nr:peptidase S8/S53 domain-containing protein [Gongronella butleri]